MGATFALRWEPHGSQTIKIISHMLTMKPLMETQSDCYSNVPTAMTATLRLSCDSVTLQLLLYSYKIHIWGGGVGVSRLHNLKNKNRERTKLEQNNILSKIFPL